MPLTPRQEDRPWGNFIEFTKNEKTTVKVISVKPGESLSLQSHKDRDEFWRMLWGTGSVVVGEEHLEAAPGKEFFVPRGTLHRIEAGSTGLCLLEIAFGEFDEDDITRFEDRYGRVSVKDK